MRLVRRVSGFILTVLMLIQLFPADTVFAASTYGTQPAPEKLMVSATNPSQPAIGYNKLEGSTGYYVDIGWDQNLKSPIPAPSGMAQYLNFYAQEIRKPYKPGATTSVLKAGAVSKSTVPPMRLRDFQSGTMYYINAKAYYTYPDPNPLSTGTLTSAESPVSNPVKVLTDIDISAVPAGTNSIKIIWDDVWDVGKRIRYKLFISDNENFANTLPIRIGPDQISADGPVIVNESSGKLEYTYTQADPARVYYVKIMPDIADTDINYTPETKTIPVSSYILVKTTKVAETGSGATAQTIWQLDWSPVVTGLDNTGVTITYELDKYVNDVPIPMLLESSTTTFITLPAGSDSVYYKIWATVLKNGLPLYPPSVVIQSDKFAVKDQEVSAYPPAPEIVDQFISASDGTTVITSYASKLTPTSATVLWRVPRKANGQVDEDTMYDIWLVSDPNQIEDPPNNTRVATGIKMTDSNKVTDGNNLVGYKFTVSNLTPNSTYYFKIVARKTFIEYRNNKLTSVDYPSNPSLKVIITPAQGPIDQPLIPATPPFKVKKTGDLDSGKYLVTDTSVTVQLPNKWYEKYDSVASKWNYIDVTKLPNTDPDKIAFKKLENKDADADWNTYRIVSYDNGVTLDVGCVPFTEGMLVSDINNMPANRVVGYAVTANDIQDEDKSANLDQQLHNVNIPLTGLQPNTTYIIWVRATRQSANLSSGPSNPLIVTTNPTDVTQVEKPVVPSFNYSFAGDTYVDLGWDMKSGYKYHIKYGTVDNIAQASGTADTSTKEITDSGLSYFRITGLKPNTLYFFWIQAEATNGTLSSTSEWGDSFPLQTKPDIPPATPRGFGVKSPQDSNITKNAITFEWIKEDGMQYILEVAGDTTYKDAKTYQAGAVSEFTIDGLKSNFRYYIRLYALDTAKNLKSAPTQSITVRTKRSSDDYDSDQDIENVISGDYIVKDSTVIKGVWTIKIVGANADRFVEHIQNDSYLDYSIDLTKPPTKATTINVLIGNKVFVSLNRLGENIRLATSGSTVIIRPNVLGNDLGTSSADYNYQISITSPSTTADMDGANMVLKSSVTDIGIQAYSGSNATPLSALKNPLKVSVPYSGAGWYKEGTTSGYIYDAAQSKWSKVSTINKFDSDTALGSVNFEMSKTGNMAVADEGKAYFDDIVGTEYENAIENVAALHPLKSVAGKSFSPDDAAKVGDMVKLAMDVMDYNYGSDFMSVAAKAKLIGSDQQKNTNGTLSRENAIAMVSRLYELKTKETAKPKSLSASGYSDLVQVSPAVLQKVMFAIENGLVTGGDGQTLGPKESITRGEFMGMLEKLLALVGEID